jgi:hypothetical protein
MTVKKIKYPRRAEGHWPTSGKWVRFGNNILAKSKTKIG